MTPDPKFSAGARYERKVFRAHLRRALLRGGTLASALAYVLSRQARYDKKPGGLGKK